MSTPNIQNLPGTLAAKLEMAIERGQIKPVKEVVVVVPPKVGGINPILAMQEFKASKPKPVDREAQLIVEAGYHCGWSLDEIQAKLTEVGYHFSNDEVDAIYDAYVETIKE